MSEEEKKGETTERSEKEDEGEEEEEDEDALTQNEKEKLWKAFSAFDKDGDGSIDAQEFHIIIKMLGEEITEEEIYRMLSLADPEKPDRITFP